MGAAKVLNLLGIKVDIVRAAPANNAPDNE